MLLLVLMSNHVGKQTVMQKSAKIATLFGASVYDVYSPVALQLRAPPQSKRKSPCAQVISL